ncbi:hypothetical protein LTR56_015137 [Elasticomyces elasticus]|nr:hypothetical protein LTR56_015137 [Elasticomyces elasticus]KAK3651979.1 hypothetical protein LTR22_011909 [Elasticomyces elasticus]KAK4919068.1 hypothetical protein LTR49_013239 [Elasticomyces elasticus]KAK5765700.1 hypothetical protein LTS12_004206 [Elasticomyces elasticus]
MVPPTLQNVAQELADICDHAAQLGIRKHELDTKAAEQEAQLAITKQEAHELSRKIKEAAKRREASLIETLGGGGQRTAAEAPVSASSAVVDLTADEPVRKSKAFSQALTGVRARPDTALLTPSKVGDFVKGKNGAPDILPGYPTVVMLNNAWTEIWCHICGRNVNTAGNFLLGIAGLHAHIMYHDGSGKRKAGVTMQDVLTNCGRRELSKQDMAAIRSGKVPPVKIEMRVAREVESVAPTPSERVRASNDCDLLDLKIEGMNEQRDDDDDVDSLLTPASSTPSFQTAVNARDSLGRTAKKRVAYEADSDEETDENALAGWMQNGTKRVCARNEAPIEPAGLEEEAGNIVFSTSTSPVQVKEEGGEIL